MAGVPGEAPWMHGHEPSRKKCCTRVQVKESTPKPTYKGSKHHFHKLPDQKGGEYRKPERHGSRHKVSKPGVF